LAENVRTIHSGDELRFRKGVWSFTEATIQLAGQSERVRAFFLGMHAAFLREREADADAIAREAGAGEAELDAYCGALERLREQGFLRAANGPAPADLVRELLGGTTAGFEQYVGRARPVLFVADTASARASAAALALEMGLPMDVLSEDDMRALTEADLTSRTDAVQHVTATGRFETQLDRYCCVVGCFVDPNLSLLRNLNRVLIELEKPAVMALVDGPFLSAIGFSPLQTGCFECFEQRMLVRMEDTAVYADFVRARAGDPNRGSVPAAHIQMLVGAVLGEGYLYATLGMFRLAGRMLNVYLPLLEIQVQDLLRVPYCPGCGFIARAQMHDLYVSSKRLVSDLLAERET
jgi:thiazole/oxazole-forming peptide maturase SagC family component